MTHSDSLISVYQASIHPSKWHESIFDFMDVSENTRCDYKLRVNAFLQFIQVSGFNQNSYFDFKQYLSQKPDWSISTKNKYLIVARIYCKELHRQGHVPIDITQNIKSFQQSRKHKKDGFTEEEVQKILVFIQTQANSRKTIRLKAVLSLLILQGLRQVEIVRLNIRDIDLVSNTANVQGKGRDDKEIIHLHPVAVVALKAYIKHYKVSDGALFTSTSNNCTHQRLTTRSIRNMINPVLRHLQLEKTVHGFRHYFTTKLIKSYQGDLLMVAQYTRHKSLEMLQIYNDSIKMKEDLPRYYQVFSSIDFNQA